MSQIIIGDFKRKSCFSKSHKNIRPHRRATTQKVFEGVLNDGQKNFYLKGTSLNKKNPKIFKGHLKLKEDNATKDAVWVIIEDFDKKNKSAITRKNVSPKAVKCLVRVL